MECSDTCCLDSSPALLLRCLSADWCGRSSLPVSVEADDDEEEDDAAAAEVDAVS